MFATYADKLSGSQVMPGVRSTQLELCAQLPTDAHRTLKPCAGEEERGGRQGMAMHMSRNKISVCSPCHAVPTLGAHVLWYDVHMHII